MGGKISKSAGTKAAATKAKSASKTTSKAAAKPAAKTQSKTTAKSAAAKPAAKTTAKAATKTAAKKPTAGVDENGTFRAWDNAKTVSKKPVEKKADFVPGTTAEQAAKKLAAAKNAKNIFAQ